MEKIEKSKHKFKPFNKVLVRDFDDEEWEPQLFSRERAHEFRIYGTLSGEAYAQCIPYNGNEHLVGTTDKPEE